MKAPRLSRAKFARLRRESACIFSHIGFPAAGYCPQHHGVKTKSALRVLRDIFRIGGVTRHPGGATTFTTYRGFDISGGPV